MFRQNLLTAKRAIPAPSPIRITTNITIDVTHIVPVLLVECVVADLAEPASPKDQALLEVEANTLEKERVLQAAVMLEVGVASEGAVEVRHAGGEVLGERVDVAGGNLGAGGRGAAR